MKRTIWIVASVVALVALLGGAAFVGGRLLAGREQPDGAPQIVSNIPDGEGNVSQAIGVEMDMAPELPEAAPDVFGIFQEREDKSIWIGTGEVKPVITEKKDGTVDFQLTHTGPKIEVVVTGKTKVYRDMTEMDFGETSKSIQQKVEAGSVDDIGSDSTVMVWGQRTGDRIIAQVLFYSPPMIATMPGQ